MQFLVTGEITIPLNASSAEAAYEAARSVHIINADDSAVDFLIAQVTEITVEDYALAELEDSHAQLETRVGDAFERSKWSGLSLQETEELFNRIGGIIATTQPAADCP